MSGHYALINLPEEQRENYNMTYVNLIVSPTCYSDGFFSKFILKIVGVETAVLNDFINTFKNFQDIFVKNYFSEETWGWQ